MFSSFRSWSLGLLFSGVVGVHAVAAAPDGLVISGSVTEGSGSNTSYLVVDFGATTGNTYAFEYLWDTATDGYGLVTALSDGLANLNITATDYGESAPNYFIDNVVFNAEAGDPSQYWAQWEGFYDMTLGDVAWAGGLGVSNVQLADGLYVGLSNPFSLAEGDEPVLPVPEPGVAVLLAVSAMTLMRRRCAC